jgi:hypothetical protein
MFRLLIAAMATCLVGCAQTSVMQYDAQTVQITTSAAPICGGSGAQKVAYQRAAIETINHGFDRFVIAGADARNNVRVVGTTPVQATTSGTTTGTINGDSIFAQNQSTTSFSGGQPILGGSHDQTLLVKMFKDGDPNGANAVSARDTLGPGWATIVTKPPATC